MSPPDEKGSGNKVTFAKLLEYQVSKYLRSGNNFNKKRFQLVHIIKCLQNADALKKGNLLTLPVMIAVNISGFSLCLGLPTSVMVSGPLTIPLYLFPCLAPSHAKLGA